MSLQWYIIDNKREYAVIPKLADKPYTRGDGPATLAYVRSLCRGERTEFLTRKVREVGAFRLVREYDDEQYSLECPELGEGYDFRPEDALLQSKVGLNDEQVFTIISAPAIPLRGWETPPDKHWFFGDQSDYFGLSPLCVCQAYAIIGSLLMRFNSSDLAPAFHPSKAPIKHAQQILDSTAELLRQLNAGEADDLPWCDAVRIAQKSMVDEIHKQYEWLTAKFENTRTIRHFVLEGHRASALDHFISAQVAGCFFQLTGRKAAGGWRTGKSTSAKGSRAINEAAHPFVRFAVAFFEQVGLPVSGQTVNRGLYRKTGW